ncbi:MAG TPA: PPC domain-containing protein, partial [Aggregatilineaceae bacterium]|nr:PPC domain-containing protein [Aggregatilineaceae bacterium]
MIKAQFLILILLLLIPFTAAHAAPPQQDSTPMRYGDSLPGEITEDTACEYYGFEGLTGDAITLDMTRTSGDLDGVLWLYDPNNTTEALATNDDRPSGSTDPLLEFTLPQSGQYTIAACRLVHERMRPTTGAYMLTLTGPQPTAEEGEMNAPSGTGAATPTVPSLTEGLFGDAGGSAAPTPTPTPGSGGFTGEVLPGEPTENPANTELLPDQPVSGTLASGAEAVSYTLAVSAGDQVRLEWTQTGGSVAPQIVVLDEQQNMIAQAETGDPVEQLRLSFRAPADEVLSVQVKRYADQVDDTSGDYTLTATLSTASGEGAGAAEGAGAPDVSANACRSGDNVLTGTQETELLAQAYTASGDGFTPSEVTATGDFLIDDDINVVFAVHTPGDPTYVSAMFCAPDGQIYDGGTAEVSDTVRYLIGLDYEYLGANWITGAWYVELYVDGV